MVASGSPFVILRDQICMSKAEIKPLSAINTEVEVLVSRFLHDFRNQLGGLKLYAAWLKKSLANDTLDVPEGIEVCEKILQQIDALTLQTKETARSLKASMKS